MKTLLSVLVSVVLSVSAMLGLLHSTPKANEFTALRQATWQTEMKVEGVTLGSCSAVLIQPHILLSAAHCNVGEAYIGKEKLVVLKEDKSVDLLLLYSRSIVDGAIPIAGVDAPLDTHVVVVGYPLGEGQVVTEGVVQKVTMDEIPTSVFLMTAPTIFGNSGGPVFAKVHGRYMVVGITDAVSVVYGMVPIPHLAFAVRAAVINEFLKDGEANHYFTLP